MAYTYAGVAGVDPRPFTLRKLAWLAAGRYDAELRAVTTAVATLFADDDEVDPDELLANPYRPTTRKPKPPRRDQSDAAFDLAEKILSGRMD